MATTALDPQSARWESTLAERDPDAYDNAPSRVFDARFILANIRRKLGLVVAILALTLIAGLLYTMSQPSLYTAQTSIQINDQSERVLREGEDLESTNLYDERFLKTQIDVLKSRGLAVRVAQKLKLFGNPRFAAVMGGEEATGLPAAVDREITLGRLRGNLKVNLPFDSRIVSITFTSRDPALSAQVANAFATEFIQSNLQRKYDSSAYARQFVSNQLAETKQRVEDSERALNAYARSAGLISLGGGSEGGEDDAGGGASGGSVTTASLLQLNSAANDARQARIAAEVRWKAFNSVPLASTKDVLANGNYQTLLSQRAGLETKLQELRAEHLEDYPGVRELKAQVAEINRQLQMTANNVRNSVRSDLTSAIAAESELANQVNSLKGATLSEQDRSVQYNLLSREADTNRELYDGLLQRYKELNAAAGVATSNVSIIDQAEPPLGPSSPNHTRNMALALFIGLLLATAVVFLAIQLDDAIRVPEDMEAKLGLPMLGIIPQSEGDPQQALLDPKSQVSEGYNALRASLLHATPAGIPAVILVTSAQPGEGKTTTSQAISLTLARLGKSVLLVDGDLRRPAVHTVFRLANERGLSSLLASLDPLQSAIQPSAEPRLSLLPSGPVPPSPTELIASNRFRALIDEMAEKFDVVVIDSPPILGLADAPTMAALADGVVFVVEAGRSRRGGLKGALRRLRAMRPNLLGGVLTKFDTSKAANKYSDYYGSQNYEYRDQNAAA